ncbi:unnamed protein product [Callosobruchus maculatus]|uniref:C2H2-type domain-containing protein n=1 Tax=Callosobruchus maculatus TaxID=64391 RepID=A0A653CYK5_CALMS|nr:unnamed protein product [Callosobruchus maculatus]
MDLGIETVEIKQEVEEHYGNDSVVCSVVHIKLEQSYSKECEGIQTEPITDEGEANLAIEAVDIERIKDQPAVVIKSEKLEEQPGINYKEFHTSGFDPDLNIKAEYDLETKSDPAMVRMKAGQNVQSWDEANLTSDEVGQINLEDFPALKVEELELKEELNIKPETIDTLSNSLFNRTAKTKMLGKEHIGTEIGLLICDNCNNTFSSRTALINHMCTGKINLKIGSGRRKLVHRRQRPSYSFLCTHCNVAFTRKDTFHDHIIKKHKEFVALVTSKIHECIHCKYKTARKNKLAKHMLKHATLTFSICEYCNASYKRKETLDDHIIRHHPEIKTSIKRKLHECPQCDYKTTRKYSLTMHMLVHPGTKSELGTCKYCNESFKGKTSLDNHIIKSHPDFITSIKRKIHECKECNYKTTRKNALDRHTLTHSGAASKILVCEHCNATFKREETLDNHIFKNHPNFISSIKRKILQCPRCSYKTTVKNTLRRHIVAHSKEAATLSVCQECNASFKHRVSLHDHILKKHPDLMASIERKMHECTQCDYKTVKKHHLTKHMLKHDGMAFTPCICEHCHASFKSKETLESHILRIHPNFVESIKSKIHECTQCNYRTIKKYTLTRHLLTHPTTNFESSIERKIHRCELCSYRSTLKNNVNRHIRLTHPSMELEKTL